MLYALLDFDTLKKYNISIEEFIKTAKGLKAKILQYRDKNSTLEEKIKRIKLIRKLWKKILIVNDTLELLEYADGIHIGQEDLKELCEKFNLQANKIIEKIKNGKWKMKNGKFQFTNSSFSTLNSQFIVGLSTHNKEEILKANKLPLDYIGLGAYRPTSTKDTSNILGEKIEELILYSHHPVAIIGGVRLKDKIKANYKVVGSDICNFIKKEHKRQLKKQIQ